MNARPGLDDPVAYKAWVNIPFDQRAEVNRIYANMGKAIAAYVRTIMPGPARFDRYVEAILKNDRSRMDQIFSDKEAGGLRLFHRESEMHQLPHGTTVHQRGFSQHTCG